MTKEEALDLIKLEAERACSIYPDFHSAHEGFAVLKEEVDELWDEVRKSPKNRSIDWMKEEAVQVGAMALRFLVDICHDGNHGKLE